MHRAWCRLLYVLVIVSGTLLVVPAAATTVQAQAPAWAEPRALNIVDMAGQVPDSVLAGNIVSFGFGGIARFVSSQQDGDRLTITVRLNPRSFRNGDGTYSTVFLLLARRPAEDHMGSSMPESWLRVYDGTQEITDRIRYGRLVRADLALPLAGSGAPERYMEYWFEPPFTFEADGLRLPANYGGTLTITDSELYSELRAVFTVRPTNRPVVRQVGEETHTYRSFIGGADVGKFQPLTTQLQSTFNERHERLALSVPSEANYVLFTYGPMPFDVYTMPPSGSEDLNLQRPIAGTVRLTSDGFMLSQDLSHGGAFPLDVWWQDADQVLDSPYLSVFRTPVTQITAPEFPVLPGTPFHPCYLTGQCPRDVLDDIVSRTSSIRVIYLQVTPPQAGTTTVPLRIADDSWSPQLGVLAAGLEQAQHRVYMPTISVDTGTKERPAGVFDVVSHRMVGYLP